MPKRGPPRRDKAAQKRWLEDKRLQPGGGGEGAAPGVARGAGGQAVTAEEDFRAYYLSQGLFGEGPEADEEFRAMWQSLHSPLPVSVRVNGSSPHREPTERLLAARGWARRREFDGAGLSVWELGDARYSARGGCKSWAERENRVGSFSFQELVSLVPALLLAPAAGHLCLDVCAAPGSKSGQLLEGLAAGGGGWSETAGAVLSADSDAKRCCLALHRNLAKLCSPASCAALANAKDFPVLLDPSGGGRMGYDRILADVPCSGDGTARKNAQLWRSWARTEALKLFATQRNILSRALYLLPPGGLLAYSTCSLNPVENEAVVHSTLQRWRGRGGAPLELEDAVEACRRGCGLRAAPGLLAWRVPCPGRGAPVLPSWEDVPEGLRAEQGGLLRSEMFAPPGGAPPELRRCARLYPHHGDTGGFFVALIRKLDTPAASAPAPAVRDDPRGGGLTGGGACTGGRTHPLLTQRFSRVRAEDPAWRELAAFFSLDPAWAEDRLRRGLLFWQTLNQGDRPGRVALASEGVARLWEAAERCAERTQKSLPWVRLGTFVFEQLPRGLLAGVVPCRWRVASEGAALVAAAVGRRRVAIPAPLALRLLRAEHRQGAAAELPPGVARGAGGAARAGEAPAPEGHHECGAVLVEVAGAPHGCWLPGVLTPRQIRLLVDDDHAASLADALEAAGVRAAAPHQGWCGGGCWSGALGALRALRARRRAPAAE